MSSAENLTDQTNHKGCWVLEVCFRSPLNEDMLPCDVHRGANSSSSNARQQATPAVRDVGSAQKKKDIAEKTNGWKLKWEVSVNNSSFHFGGIFCQRPFQEKEQSILRLKIHRIQHQICQMQNSGSKSSHFSHLRTQPLDNIVV